MDINRQVKEGNSFITFASRRWKEEALGGERTRERTKKRETGEASEGRSEIERRLLIL